MYLKSDEYLHIQWSAGGVSGGNCWNEGGHYSYSGEQEPPFLELYNYLEEKAPTLSFLHFKLLETKINYELEEHNEYYGNHSSYHNKWIKISDIDDFLKENGYV